MKNEIRSKYSSILSIVEFSATKKISKMTKELWFDVNPKYEGEDSILKEG